jgi:hypothetical protein
MGVICHQISSLFHILLLTGKIEFDGKIISGTILPVNSILMVREKHD